MGSHLKALGRFILAPFLFLLIVMVEISDEKEKIKMNNESHRYIPNVIHRIEAEERNKK